MHLITYFPLHARVLLMKVSPFYCLYPTRIWVLLHWDVAHPELLLLVVWINVPKQSDNTNTLVWGLHHQSNYTYTQRESKRKSSACFFVKVSRNLDSDPHTERFPWSRGAAHTALGDTGDPMQLPAASSSGALSLAKAASQSEGGKPAT